MIGPEFRCPDFGFQTIPISAIQTIEIVSGQKSPDYLRSTAIDDIDER